MIFLYLSFCLSYYAYVCKLPVAQMNYAIESGRNLEEIKGMNESANLMPSGW